MVFSEELGRLQQKVGPGNPAVQGPIPKEYLLQPNRILVDNQDFAPGLDRSLPRIDGMVQNVQFWLHPSPTRRYA